MSTEYTAEEAERSHRWHASECNNLAWDLSVRADRTSQEDETMLHAAHASFFHWATVGTELNLARAQMLLGQVYAALGRGEPALEYARRSHDYFLVREPPDWEIAFSHAILAHAAFAAADAALHRHHFSKARELGEAIADPEDREIFLQTFRTIPSP